MNHPRLEEEIEAIRAIYCKEGELAVRNDAEGHYLTVNFSFCPKSDRLHNGEFDGYISFVLASKYPEGDIPKVIVRCADLPSDRTGFVLQQIEERAATLEGQPMILDLCYLCQDLLRTEIETLHSSAARVDEDCISTRMESMDSLPMAEEYGKKKQKTFNSQTTPTNSIISPKSKVVSSDGEDLASSKANSSLPAKPVLTTVENKSTFVTALLHLDHMRSKQSYIKLIKKWAAQLTLSGRLIFCQRLIVILLQGNSQDIKEYIVRNRTANVDVDSKGKSCKERMLTVLCEIQSQIYSRLPDFCMLELSSRGELQDFFQSLGMRNIYDEYVRSLLCMPGT